MKKWLVGLVAAGLCAASAWAANYTQVTSMEEFGAGNYVITGEKTDGGEAAMLNVVDKGNFIQTADVTVVDGVVSDPDASIVWTVEADEVGDGWTIYNEGAGGYVNYPGGKNNAATEATVTEYSTWTISGDGGVFTVDNVGVVGRKLQYNKSAPRFACYTTAQTPLKFYKEGDGTFSVEVEPSIDFRLEAAEWALTEGNQGAYLTAVPKNGVGDIRYEWLGSFEGTDETLRIPDGLVAGVDGPTSYSVTVTATDSAEPEPRRAMAEFSFTLARAPGLYTVAVADGIGNGSVEIWQDDAQMESPAEVYEGTTVKVVATPADRSYKVESVSVAATDDPSNTVPLEDGEFTMPGFDVTVTATFTKWEGTIYALVESMDDFEAGADYLVVAGTDAMMNATNGERIAVSAVEITDGVVATEDDSIVWTIDNGSEGKYTLHNAAAGVYVSAPSYETTGAASLTEYGTAAEAQWTIAIDDESALATIGSIYDGKSLLRNNSHPYFAVYSGGTKPNLYKKVGAGVFSISLDPSGEDVVFAEGEGGIITATPKNAQGSVTYTWNWTEEGPGSASEDGSQWTIPADAPTGSWTLYCSAKDEAGNEADASVSFSILEVYTVTVAGDIVGGSVVAEPMSGVAGTPITVTATADGGYKCGSILVNGESFDGPTYVFELPEGGAEVSATFVESTGEIFTLLSDADGLQNGTRVVLTDPDGALALPALVTGSVFAVTAVAPVNDAITTEDASIVWTLVDDGNGHFSLYNEAAKKYAGHGGGGNSNSGRLQDKPFPHAISAGEGLFAIAATAADGAGNYRSLQYNPNVQQGVANPRFAYYKGGQKNLRIYAAGVAPAAFSITLSQEEDFTVVEGEAFSIKAEPKNNVGDVKYVWTVDGEAAETDGAMLSLTAGEASETAHEVVCTATDTGAEEGAEPAVASVRYTVVKAPELFTVTISEGIENGEVKLFDGETVLASGAEVPEGTAVTVVAEPADGFELEAVTVNGEPIEGDSFTVAGDTVVSATFTALKDYATLPFLAEDTPFTGPWQNPKAAGVTANGLDTDYNNKTDGRGAKFDTAGDWLQVKFEGMPGELSYALKGNNTSAESVSTFDVLESETGGDGTWTAVMTHRSDINLFNNTKTNFTSELKPVSRYVKFVYTEKAQGNVGLYDVYIERGGFSVSLSVKDGAEFEQGETVMVKATPKHHNGDEVTYSWTLDGVAASADGDELALDTGVLGEHTVVCRATQHMALGETAEAEASATYTVVQARPKFTVTIAEGIENGSVAIRVDGETVAVPAELPAGTEVTVVATPAGGYKTEAITVNGDALSGDTFTVTEDAEVSATFVDRGDEFVRITDLDGLEEGDYVITGAGTDGEYAMKAELSEGSTVYVKRQETPVEIENDAIAGPDDSIVWTVGKVDDGWTVYNEAIGYVGYVASDNSAGAEEEATAKSTWTVSEAGGELFLLTNVGNTGRMLLYNASAPRFACYTKTSSGKALAFYKKAGAAKFTVGVDETGFVLKQGEEKTVTASAKHGNGEVTYAWSSETLELNQSGRELAIPGTLEPGAYSAMVTATDSSEPQQTDEAELTFTVVATYPVTVAETIENGSVAVDKAIAAAGETVTVTATPADDYKLLSIRVNGQPIEGNTFEMPGGPAEVSAVFAKIALYPITIDGNIAHGEIAADKDEAEPGETVTLTAEAEVGWKLDTFLLNGEPFGGDSFAMPEGEAQVSAVFVQRVLVTYVPVESADDFVAGGEYLLVAVKEEAFTSAMKNAANGSRIGVDEVEIAGDGSISTDNGAILWTIGAGEEDGHFTLFNSEAGVYAAGPDAAGNNAQLVADGTSPLAQWTLDLSEAPLAKIGSVAYDGRYLQRNADKGNPYFATYVPGQTLPTLFKKAGPPPFQVGIDAEDGFILAEGTSRTLRAEAENGVEPYDYVWSSETPELGGTGPTLDIPASLEASDEPYSVTVAATDATEAEAKATISFFVKPLYSVTIDPGITGGTVTADKERAFEGDTVTLAVEEAPNYTLVAVFVNDDELTGTSFPMPASDVLVSATFAEVVDYATLPFIAKDTPYGGPWKNAEMPGLTNEGLDNDYGDGSAKFRSTGAWMQIKFRGTPGTLSFGIKGNGTTETNVSTFVVQESADGGTWTPVAVFTSDDNLTNSRQDVGCTLSADSRYVRFLYQEKGDGNVGIYDVYIGEAGEAEATVTVTGETTLTLGGTFALELALENYSGGFAWAWAPATVGYVDAETATWWWQPTKTGETEMTFSAMDGDRTIASETVTLTVVGAPALVFGGDDEGTVQTPVEFTVVAENVADPTVTFIGFLAVPEDSTLTDADVILDYPNVTFTPDVAGEYGLAFCAGTAGVDYVEDVWAVTVQEPEVKIDGDDTGTTGRSVKFKVSAVAPGAEIDFVNYLCQFPEGSSLTKADVTIDTETGEVSFTPDVPGNYGFKFAVVGSEEFYSWTVTVEGGGPAPVPARITAMEIENGQMKIWFEGDNVRVVVSGDLLHWEEFQTTSPYPLEMRSGRQYIGVRND